MREFMQLHVVELVVSGAIIGAFLASCLEAQLLPEDGTPARTVFDVLEILFSIFFLEELALNLFGYWFLAFVTNAWFITDTVVVVLLIISQFPDTNLPTLQVLRLVRTLKMIKLLRAQTSLRIILLAIVNSMVPVLHSFAIFFLITSVYAVMSTHFFRLEEPDFFGDFTLSLLTLLQIATGDSWASAITRPMVLNRADGMGGLVGIFMVSYVLVVGMICFNIVVAVLLGESSASLQAPASSSADVQFQSGMPVCRACQNADIPARSRRHNSTQQSHLRARARHIKIRDCQQ